MKKHVIGRSPLLICSGALALTLCGAPLVDGIFRKTNASPETTVPDSNHGYFKQFAKNDKNLAAIVKNGRHALAEHISDALRKLRPVTPTNYPYPDIKVMESPTVEELEQLEDAQLIKIYYLLKALSDSEFRKNVVEELEKDTADRTSEHGGVIRLSRSGLVTIEMIPNEDTYGDPIFFGWISSDERYTPNNIPSTPDILGPFHFHASSISPGYSAFSGNDFFTYANVLGFTEFVLFSRPSRDKFNVDIGIVLLQRDGTTIKARLDIDLGEY